MKQAWWRSRWIGEPKLLIGVRAICRYAVIGPATFYDWKDHYDFPVAPLPDGRWCTSVTLVDRWIEQRRAESLAEATDRQDAPASVDQNGSESGEAAKEVESMESDKVNGIEAQGDGERTSK
jgi:hypothetical protein